MLASFVGGLFSAILIVITCIASFKFGLWLGLKVREPPNIVKIAQDLYPPPTPIYLPPLQNGRLQDEPKKTNEDVGIEFTKRMADTGHATIKFTKREVQ